jgi:hypothetical protein
MDNRFMKVARIAVACLALATGLELQKSALGALHNVQFAGSVTSLNAGLASQFAVNDPISGSFVFDDSKPNIGFGTTGLYNAITSFNVTVGSYTATLSNPLGASDRG